MYKIADKLGAEIVGYLIQHIEGCLEGGGTKKYPTKTHKMVG